MKKKKNESLSLVWSLFIIIFKQLLQHFKFYFPNNLLIQICWHFYWIKFGHLHILLNYCTTVSGNKSHLEILVCLSIYLSFTARSLFLLVLLLLYFKFFSSVFIWQWNLVVNNYSLKLKVFWGDFLIFVFADNGYLI